MAPELQHPGVFVAEPLRDLAKVPFCDEPILLSKDTEKGKIHVYARRPDQCPCRCKHPQLGLLESYKLNFRFFWQLARPGNVPCDEIGVAGVLDGCYVKGSGTLALRRHRCNDQEILVGCQEGRFIIYRPIDPAGFVAVFQGQLTGTVGVSAHLEGPERCCTEGHTDGSLRARGLNDQDDCELCATYHGFIRGLDPDRVCDGQTADWRVAIDGIVCCPCRKVVKGYEEKKK